MLIKCKLLRPGGTTVELGKGPDKREYQFVPAKGGNPDEHVCEVTDAADIATLLAIKEGYEVHSSELKKKSTEKPAAGTGAAPATKAADPASTTANSAGKADYSKMDKAALVKAIIERTGEAPHPSTGVKKMVATLEALDADQK